MKLDEPLMPFKAIAFLITKVASCLGMGLHRITIRGLTLKSFYMSVVIKVLLCRPVLDKGPDQILSTEIAQGEIRNRLFPPE